MKRCRLMKDDSGHDYVVPMELCDEFEEWAFSEDPEIDPHNFAEMMLNYSMCRYSFTDFKHDDELKEGE